MLQPKGIPDVIWNNCTQYESNELEQETLSVRRNKHKLILFYKMRNNLCPEYLSSLVPTNVGSTVGYSLRNANDIRTVNANTQLYFNSLLPSVIRVAFFTTFMTL